MRHHHILASPFVLGVVGSLVLLGAGADDAFAASEARCAELGASCVCSEPLDTTTYTQIPNIDWAWNPGDTTNSDKECNTSGQKGAFVEVNGFDTHYTVASSGAPMGALPKGHKNSHVLRLLDGVGGMFAGVHFAANQPHARRGFRYYKYYSPDYTFTYDAPGCNSSKWAQMGQGAAATSGPLMTEQEWSFYDVEKSTGWNQDAKGCCFGPGPGNSAAIPTNGSLKGKWVRLEFYMNNTDTTGAPTTFEAWLKNVTDDLPEIKVVDSTVLKNFPNGEAWTSSLATGLHPMKPISDMSINMFRSNNGDPCGGYAAFAYFVAAAWPTAAGQRIGAASEIEGNDSPDAGAPGAPVDGGSGTDGGRVVDGGTENAEAPSAGCACNASPQSAAESWIAIVALLGLLRARRSK